MKTTGNTLGALLLIIAGIAWGVLIEIQAEERPSSDYMPLSFYKEPIPLPELHFIDGNSHKRSLAEFRGKVVLLNIWATWCTPCRVEMPGLDKLQSRLGGADFQVVALSTDQNGVPVVKAFYEKTGIESLELFVDPSGKVAEDLRVMGYPTTLLLNREGAALGVKIGPANWNSSEVVSLIRKEIATTNVSLTYGQ